MTVDSNYTEHLHDRECPECEGTCYDAQGRPCRACYGEGVIIPLTSLRGRGRMVS
jgi:DnaJ-class molecular chaperone